MNRRTLFKSLLGGAAAPVVPASMPVVPADSAAVAEAWKKAVRLMESEEEIDPLAPLFDSSQGVRVYFRGPGYTGNEKVKS